MSRQIVTVTLSPSIDTTLFVDGLDTDKTNRVLGERYDCGGKGVNVSRVAFSFGVNTTCLAVTGEENMLEFASFLKKDGLRFDLLPIPGAVRENLTLRAGKQTIKLNRQGPTLSRMMTAALMAMIRRWVRPDDIVVFAGSLPANFAMQDFAEIVLATKQAGAHVALDCGEITMEALRTIRPWLIKPNIHELCAICPQAANGVDGIIAAAKQLRQAGVENVLVTRGPDGMMLFCEDKVITASAPAVEVASTVGAGDSALAGFAVGFVRQMPVEDCLRMAAASGTAAVMQEGTRLATRAAAEELLDKVTLEEVAL